MPQDPPELPAHIEQTIAAISHVHAQHHRQTRPVHKAVVAVTAAIGRPAFLTVLSVFIAGWVAINLAMQGSGHRPFDPPPFNLLACVASVAALFVTAMILTTQRHDDELATHRDQLTLELAILSEQKSAKIIRLLEEIRRADPARSNDPDAEAEAMAVPTDPQAVLAKIKTMNEALRQNS